MRRLWKVLNADGSCCHGGGGAWDLSGGWMPEIEGELRPCENGYHVLADHHLVRWLGPAIFPVEVDGNVMECEDKIVARRARLIGDALPAWNERSARHFACDCAARALKIAGDCRFDDVVRTARLYADGRASRQDVAAAMGATSNAAWDGGVDAWDAAWAAWSAGRSVARMAARDAAKHAVWLASSGYRPAAEREWQTRRLFAYLDGRIVLNGAASGEVT